MTSRSPRSRSHRRWAGSPRAGRPARQPSARGDILGLLRALHGVAVGCVLIGALAEMLHGSPLLPVTSAVGDRRSAVIAAGSGHPTASSATWAIDALAGFALELYGAELVVAPAGNRGDEDLQRATPIRIDADLKVRVAG